MTLDVNPDQGTCNQGSVHTECNGRSRAQWIFQTELGVNEGFNLCTAGVFLQRTDVNGLQAANETLFNWHIQSVTA